MKKELLQEYTRRVTQSNRSQLVVIIYELILEYIKEGKENMEKGKETEFCQAMKKAQQFIRELISALNFEYSIAKELLPLYRYFYGVLAKSMVSKNVEELTRVEGMIAQLKIAFQEVEKQDFSRPLMENTQQVYAGLTYGRKILPELYQDSDNNRGFMA